MKISPRAKEYLTVGRTLEELRQYEPQLRAAGFRKRRGQYGKSEYTGEYYQWWDRNLLRPTAPPMDRWAWSREWKRQQVETGRCAQCAQKREPNGTKRLCRTCADKQAAHVRNCRQRRALGIR